MRPEADNFQLAKEILYHKKETIPLSSISDLRVDNGQLIVTHGEDGKTASDFMTLIPNSRSLIVMLKKRIQRRPAPAQVLPAAAN